MSANTQLFKNLFRQRKRAPAPGCAQDLPENHYGSQLTAADIRAGRHREFVGGMWEQIGLLQFQFLVQAGLRPEHRMVDIGCGCLRGGLHFVRFLDARHYYGVDINASLIEAGRQELSSLQLSVKEPNLVVKDNFDLAWFDTRFDYALAASVFTHLYANHIARCMVEVKKTLASRGKFFATFFQAPSPVHLADLKHEPGNIVTHFDRDPFHYSLEEMRALAGFAGLSVDLVGDWGHPRSQRMLCFSSAAD
jgi:hypothetical protein